MAVLTLRIEHAAAEDRSGEIRLLLRDAERVLAEDRKPFPHPLTDVDLERVQSYWEDYLDTPATESRTVQKQAERRLAIVGETLFRRIFDVGEARRLWAGISSNLSQVRVEIAQAGVAIDTLPWELMQEPATGRWIAREAAAFVRAPRHRFPESEAKPGEIGPVRALAVLASPRSGGLEIQSPFRAANMMAPGLSRVQWRVLRPQTMNALVQVITNAEAAGEPFHAVHIEGSAYCCDLSDRRELPPAIKNAARPRNEKPVDGKARILVVLPTGRRRPLAAGRLAGACGAAGRS